MSKATHMYNMRLARKHLQNHQNINNHYTLVQLAASQSWWMVQEGYEVESQHAKIFWSRTFGKIYAEDLAAVRQPTILASWFYYPMTTTFSLSLSYSLFILYPSSI